MRAALKDSALELGPELPAGSFALAVGGDDLGLLPLSMDEAGNGVLVAGPRRSGRSTALYFATSTALSGGAHVVLVLPRRSPLAGLSGHPGVLGILDTTAKPDDLKDLLRSYGPETLIVVDDYDILGNDHVLCATMEEHFKGARDTPGGLLVACGVEEAQGMYGALMARIRRTRTGILMAPRGAEDGQVLHARLPRSVGGAVPAGRGISITPAGWVWSQVPRMGDR